MRWTLEHGMMVRRFGAGPEIVWIHGLGEWSPLFDPIASHPAFAGFSHTLPDLPGYGRSPWPAHPEDLDALADRLSAWLAEVEDRRPILVGHSMGGVLAILLAERIAARAVVNIDGNLSPGDCTFSAQAAAYSPREFVEHGFSALRAEVYERGRTDVALRGYHAAMCAASPEVYHHDARQLIAVSAPETLAARMAQLRAPALFVAGVPDGICARSRELLDGHAVRWIGLEPAGHWPHWDQSERFASVVTEFLREV